MFNNLTIHIPNKMIATQKIIKPGIAVAVNNYRNDHVMNLSPVEIIQKLYDIGIVACRKHDKVLAQKVLTELISSLNFDNNEISVKLFNLYNYSKTLIRNGEFDEAGNLIEDLRDGWKKAFKL